MKEIIYTGYPKNQTFLLTDKEFDEAMLGWDSKNNYWCVRLERSLSPYFKHAGTPKEELGYQVFMLKGSNSGYKKIFLQNGTYYEKVTDNGTERKISPPELQKKETIKQLIPQEDFYQQKKYLT